MRGESGPTGVYCDLTGSRFGQKVGWMRAAAVDTSNSSTSYCAPGLKFVTEPTKACAAQPGQSCPSKVLPVDGIEYSKVCGRLLARQVGATDAFLPQYADKGNINGIYFDGVSITYGNPRKHVWTFAGADSSSKCPCYSNVYGVTPSLWAPTISVRVEPLLCGTVKAAHLSICVAEKEGPGSARTFLYQLLMIVSYVYVLLD